MKPFLLESIVSVFKIIVRKYSRISRIFLQSGISRKCGACRLPFAQYSFEDRHWMECRNMDSAFQRHREGNAENNFTALPRIFSGQKPWVWIRPVQANGVHHGVGNKREIRRGRPSVSCTAFPFYRRNIPSRVPEQKLERKETCAVFLLCTRPSTVGRNSEVEIVQKRFLTDKNVRKLCSPKNVIRLYRPYCRCK